MMKEDENEGIGIGLQLTDEQLEQLLRRGLDPDIALVPFQMPRLKQPTLDVDGLESGPPTEWIRCTASIDPRTMAYKMDTLSFRVDSVERVTLSVFVNGVLQSDGSVISDSSSVHEVLPPSTFISQVVEDTENTPLVLEVCTDAGRSISVLHISGGRVVLDSQFLLTSEGRVFGVKDIYGRQRPVSKGDEAHKGADCIVCMTSSATTVALPCRHLCLCGDCAVLLQARSNRCPICRSNVLKLVNIESDPFY